MEQRLQKRIAYLQKILDTRYPQIVSTETILPIILPIETICVLTPVVPIETDDGMTDITEDELRQRDDDEKNCKRHSVS